MNPTVDFVQPQSNFDPSLCFARQSLCRFAALTLVDPRCGTWDQLSDPLTARLVGEAADLVRNEPAAQADALGLGERPLADLGPDFVLARLPKIAASFNSVYEQTFGLLVSGNCPPYETEYINSKFTFQRSQGLADIAGFYRAFGLEPSTAHPERHDHLALELEFAAFLLGLERAAIEGDHRDRVERSTICRDAHGKFLTEHLVWWVPTFARLLSRQDPGGFYDAVSQFLAALIAAERALAGVPAPSGHVAPSTVERPEECNGCLLNS
ncbi:MAG: molecular chaperone TorD family protein [Planctomycetia bacterium]|nr:molecular chaperone TorD family protein [Planctomycetia bacterium]